MSLVEMLRPSRKTLVVDVGAAPIDEIPPYRGLMMSGCALLTGFEPNPEMFTKLKPTEDSVFLPNIVGDGLAATMHYCTAPGMNSLLRPDEAALAVFTDFPIHGRVIKTEGVMTTCLDDLVKEMDYLKVDVQGAELMVLDGAMRLLDKTVVVHAEAAFMTLYHGQPTFSELDDDLRARGFVPHRLFGPKYWALAPNRSHAQQLLEMDIVYVRDFTKIERMSDEQLKHLAIIMAYAYGETDLPDLCVNELRHRNTTRLTK